MRESIVGYSVFLFASFTSIFADDSQKIVVAPASLEEDLFFRIIAPDELSYFYRFRAARDFGTKFNFTLHNAALVPIEPPLACGAGIDNAPDIQGNVALIKRGDCSFLTKTLNAERVGAVAVIIADSNEEEPDGKLVDMIHDGTSRRPSIPAGYMQGKSGKMIRAKLKEMGARRAIIDIPVNSTAIPINVHIHQPPWSIW